MTSIAATRRSEQRHAARDQSAEPNLSDVLGNMESDWPVSGASHVRSLDSWRLIAEVGRGAWSRVHLARPIGERGSPPGCYAVKVLDDAWAGDPLAVASMRREALVGLTVSHPHLVSVLAAHVYETPCYLVAPFLPGETLAEKLRPRKPLATTTALWIARQVASALAALHSAGWTHGDVKPANIIIAPTGHATLIDLGFCQRIVAGGGYRTAAHPRPLAGTLDYIAPEIVTPHMPQGAAADLYSLGVTLFEMLAGRRPFVGHDAGSLAELHRHAAPPDLARLRPELPTDVTLIVRKLLSKQPLRRGDSAGEIARRLMRQEIATLGRAG